MRNRKSIVLYIVSMHRGGAERVMSILANSFARMGYNVTLVTDIPVLDNEENYYLIKKIKRISIESHYKDYLLKNIYRLIQLRRIVKEEKADVVLSFLGKQNYRMLLATIGLKCRKCVSVRNDPNREYGKSIFRKWLANRVFSLADACVFQTGDAKSYFNKKVQMKSVIIPNPIDEKFFDVKRVKNPRNIVTVGRLEPQKNHKLLIDAFALVADKIENEKLLIFGTGSLRESLQEYINNIGMCDRIVLMGEVDCIEKELAKARLFVLSSDYEGMSNSLMEAMAVGVPCISTDCPCGGARELLRQDEGCLVPCNDTKGLGKAICFVINNGYDNMAIDMSRYKIEEVVLKWKDILFLRSESIKSDFGGDE